MRAFLRFVEKLRLNTKLLIGFSIGLVVALVIGINAIQSLRTMSDKAQQIYDQELLAISHIKEANINLIYMGRSLRHMMLAQTADEREKARERLDLATLSLGKELGEARTRILRKEEKQKFDEFDVLFDQYKRNVAEVITLLEKDDLRKSQAVAFLSSERFQTTINSADEVLTAITKVKEQGAHETADALERMSDGAVRISLLLLTFGLLIGAAFGIVIGRSIRNPIERLRESIEGLAAGKVEAEVPYLDYRNELGTVARSVKALQDGVREMEGQRWTKTHVAEIAAELQQAHDFKELAQSAISQIAPLIDAGLGAVYVADSEGRFNLLGSYGYRERKHLNNSFAVGEGLVGQAVMEKKSITLTAPKDYLRINSGLGEALPACVAVLPIMHMDRVWGVVEVASFQQLEARAVALLDALMPTLAISMEILDRNQRTQDLLTATQEQAERMEKQAAQLEEQTVEMEAQQAELLETENWFRSIIETAPEGMMVVEESGAIVLSNPRAESLFGYDSGEMIGINVDRLVPQGIRAGHAARRHQFAAEKRSRSMGARSNLSGVRKDGAEFAIQVSLSPLPERGTRGRCVSVSVQAAS